MRVAIAFLSLLILPASFAHAEKRVALVVGNAAYQHTAKLDNPRNDAVDMVAALRKHGFEVIQGLDLDKRSFDRKVLEFAAALKGSDTGVFFYAGHGMQVAGQNYLVPTDARAEAAETLDFEMVRVDVVQRIMERLTNTNILFLDACRDNPLARNLSRSMGTRSSEVGRGLAQVEAGIGTLISFSTQPGNVALDGSGRNSPFAGALVKHMDSSHDDLSAILISVRNDVMKETQRRQVPWEHSAMTGRFFFDPAAPGAEPPKTEIITPPLAKAPAPQPRTHDKPGGSFDGTWQITWYDARGCSDPHATFSLTISNDAISSGGERPSTGRIDEAGKITFSRPARIVKGATQRYVGRLSGNAGSGRFAGGGRCAGSFTATRQ